MKNSKVNKAWHLKHKMPPKATLQQRVDWHRQHQKHCACRSAPKDIQKLIEKQR